ncbi:hypothetical protein V1507DRAFT_469615 [Lipomyces tetrasporus]
MFNSNLTSFEWLGSLACFLYCTRMVYRQHLYHRAQSDPFHRRLLWSCVQLAIASPNIVVVLLLLPLNATARPRPPI